MRSAPCASAPSHSLHAMPPRITRNSDRPRASDRTMVNSRPACRVLHTRCCHQQQRTLTRWTTSRTSSEITKQSGLDLEKQSHSSGRGGAFFLTSLFIELIDPMMSEMGIFRQLWRTLEKPASNRCAFVDSILLSRY